ncbi:MAG: DUF3592 domain-containing protein [Myxococcales bacterium]|nr:DUF3592 domain-containing protein [Myxococcales bacterium]
MLAGVAAVVVFLLTGGLIAGYGLHHALKRRRIRQWPRAQGTVLESRLMSGTSRGQDEDGESYESAWYELRIQYAYHVNGVRHVGTAYAPQPYRTGSKKAANAMVKKYGEGTVVDVLYDAADPKTAYLASPIGAGAVILIIFGSVFLVAALGTVAIIVASA